MISKALSFCPLSTQRGPSNFHDPFSSEWLGTPQPLQENSVILASDLLHFCSLHPLQLPHALSQVLVPLLFF